MASDIWWCRAPLAALRRAASEVARDPPATARQYTGWVDEPERRRAAIGLTPIRRPMSGARNEPARPSMGFEHPCQAEVPGFGASSSPNASSGRCCSIKRAASRARPASRR